MLVVVFRRILLLVAFRMTDDGMESFDETFMLDVKRKELLSGVYDWPSKLEIVFHGPQLEVVSSQGQTCFVLVTTTVIVCSGSSQPSHWFARP